MDTVSSEPLYIIDAIAPFFGSRYCKGRKTNWSKIPFPLLETNGNPDPRLFSQIIQDFRTYLSSVVAIGYNAISIDDVAHLCALPFYPDALNRKISAYQDLYKRLFDQAESLGVRVFVTTDVMFFNQFIDQRTEGTFRSTVHVFGGALRRLFARFPQIEGVIFRLGETDGLDVWDEFHSRILVRTPRQARTLIRSLLPVFEKNDKTMIVRTWTLGAFSIGDLMWNPKTYDAVFGRIHSDHLLVSMKFGDTDFYRFLQLNPLFFQDGPRKIIELQARREYEGFGELPSFVGYDYEHYRSRFSGTSQLAGIMVWCQTGGWSRFDRLSFLDGSSIWNELNAFVTLRVFRDAVSADQAIEKFAEERIAGKDPRLLVRLCKLSDALMKDLWYLPEFSSKQLYFRRVRIPPLLWVFWDTIVLNHTMRKIVRRMVVDRQEAIHNGYRALSMAREAGEIIEKLGVEYPTPRHLYDTYELIALVREYMLGPFTPELADRIAAHAHRYHETYPDSFRLEYDFSPLPPHKIIIETILRLSLRTSAPYRLIDRFVILKLTSWIYPIIRKWQKKRLPDFARSQAMGIGVLFE